MRGARAVACGILAVLTTIVVTSSLAQQSGYYVVDGFGGVHAGGGAAAVTPQTPYFGFDVAEDIEYVPPGASGNEGVLVLDAFGGVHAGGAIAGGSLAPATPYFGFDIARGIAARDRVVNGWERRASSCTTVPAGFSVGLHALCSGSKKVLGGGPVYFTDNTCATFANIATSTRFVTYSGPSSDTIWSSGIFNDSGLTIYVRVFAICAYAH